MNFKPPVETMSVEDLPQNKIKYTSLKGNKVVMPYKGDISEYNQNTCNGKLKIKHKINGKKYYSIICGIESINNDSNEIGAGNKIGEMSENTLTWMLVDSSGDSQNIYDVFKEKEGENKKDDKSGISNISSKENYADMAKNSDAVTKRVLDVMTTPLKLINKFIGSGNKVNEDKLNEEIDRIKQLLK
jgi:hypothetical protein